MYNGQGCDLSRLTLLSRAKSYSISAENPTGAKGAGGMADTGEGANAARDLGRGWKVSPNVMLQPKSNYTMADIQGEGIIRHMWLTMEPRFWRSVVLKFYWDDAEAPAVCAPLGDFFCNGWCTYTPVNSLAITVNPWAACNCYFEMPFRRHARLVVENVSTDTINFYYQVDYILTELDPDSLYFHARWNRVNPLPYKEVYTILPRIEGRGHYVGTYLAWQTNSNGWWGEGEIKFFLDGDEDYPTICGTGTEDYFCGAWGFMPGGAGAYLPYSTAYQGFTLAYQPDASLRSNQRFNMYRWHLTDPIYFEQDLRVTIQALGWRSGGRYLPLQDDIASVAYWYSDRAEDPASCPFSADELEVI